MDNALLFLKDNAVAVGIVLTIVGLIGGAIGASVRFLIDSKKIKNEKKALRQQMITNNIAPMRQAWINEVRTIISEFIAVSNSSRIYAHEFEADNKLFLNESEKYQLIASNSSKSIMALNRLKLLLPANEDDYSLLISDLTKINENMITDLLSNEDRKALVDKIINDSRRLLKKEWEVTKSLKEIE